MRKSFAAIAFLFGTSFLSAFGAIGDQQGKFAGFTANSEVQGVFTLNTNGNTINDDGTIDLSATLKMTTSSVWAGSNGLTVVIKYSNLSASANSAIFTTSLSGNSNASMWGFSVTSDMRVCGLWNANASWDSAQTETVGESGYLVFTCLYDSSYGTKVYCLTPGTDSQARLVYSSTSLLGSGNVGGTLCFGGRGNGSNRPSSMKLEGVVIYKGYPSTADDVTNVILDYDSICVSGDDSVTAVSDINSLTFTSDDSTQTNKVVTFTNDVSIAVDAALSSAVGIKSTGAVHFVPASGVDASDSTTAAYDLTKFDFSYVAGGVYHDYWVSTLKTAAYNPHYTQGAGSDSSAASLTWADDGSMDLTGGTYYYPGSAWKGTNATATVTVGDGATICFPSSVTGASARFGIGNATYTLTDDAQITATRFATVVGSAGCNSTLELNGNAAFTVTGRGTVDGTDLGTADSGDADIILGNLGSGTTTITQSDDATFTATNSVVFLRGTSVNHTININGGTMSVLGIKVGSNGGGTHALNLGGGTLNLGSSGITTSNTELPVTVSGDATIGGTATSLPITQAVTVESGASLTFTNALAETGTVTVTLSGALSSAGSLVVGENVKLVLGAGCLESTVSIDMTASSATLDVHLANDTDQVQLVLAGESVTDRLTVYDSTGAEIASPYIVVDDGVYVISTAAKVFSANEAAVSLDDSTKWTGSAAGAGDYFTIELSTDATLSADTGLTYGAVSITNTTSSALTLTLASDFSTTGLDLGANVTLAFESADTAEDSLSVPITGSGALILGSAVTNTLSGAYTFTGGMTVNGCVTLGNTSALGAGTVSGAGQVIITDASYVPYATLASGSYTDYNPLGVTFDDSSWTGTVTLRGFTRDSAFQRYSPLANASSTLEIDGTSGYFKPSDTTTAKEIRISQTTSSGSAYGLHANNGNSGTYATFIGKLTGDGPISVDASSAQFCFGFVGDCSEWTGNATVNNKCRLAFAATESDVLSCTNKVDSLNNYLLVSTNMNVSTWTMSSSGTIVVTNGVTLTATGDSSVTASTMTFADDATVSLSGTTEIYAEQSLWTGGDGVSSVYRIPAIATATNGDLIAVCDARLATSGDLHLGYEIKITVRRSTDGGETWTDPEYAYDWEWGDSGSNGTGTSASDPSLIVDKETGKIFLFYNVMDHANNPSVYNHYMQSSTDNGATWSDPVCLTETFAEQASTNDNFSAWNFGGERSDNGALFITSGSGIQTSDGTLLHTLVKSNTAIALFGSTDHGETWQIFGNPAAPGDESKVVELADGTWMDNSRYSGGGGRYIHTTSDKGQTWTSRYDTNLLDPACNAQLMRVGNILLFSNCKSTSRQNLHIRASANWGETWTDGIQIRSGSSIYSDMTLVDDETIGLLYEGYNTAGNFTIIFTKVPLADITAQLEE